MFREKYHKDYKITISSDKLSPESYIPKSMSAFSPKLVNDFKLYKSTSQNSSNRVSDSVHSRRSFEKETHLDIQIKMLSHQLSMQEKNAKRIQISLRKQLDNLNQQNLMTEQLGLEELANITKNYEEEVRNIVENNNLIIDNLNQDIEGLLKKIEERGNLANKKIKYLHAKRTDKKLQKETIIAEIRVLEQEIRNHQLMISKTYPQEVEKMEKLISKENKTHEDSLKTLISDNSKQIHQLQIQLENKEIIIKNLVEGICDLRSTDNFSDKTSDLEKAMIEEQLLQNKQTILAQKAEMLKFKSDIASQDSVNNTLELRCSDLKIKLNGLKLENSDLKYGLKGYGVSFHQKKNVNKC